MRLTQQTTYSIQTLMYCAMNQAGPSRIRDIARAYRISELHLFKIMHVLVSSGLIETLRGRNGGIRLARPAEQISLGQVVRAAEVTLQLNECVTVEGHACPLGDTCGLGPALCRALAAFMEVLDGISIAEVVASRALRAAYLPAGAPDVEDVPLAGKVRPA
jgi:Rrf2 family protein